MELAEIVRVCLRLYLFLRSWAVFFSGNKMHLRVAACRPFYCGHGTARADLNTAECVRQKSVIAKWQTTPKGYQDSLFLSLSLSWSCDEGRHF